MALVNLEIACKQVLGVTPQRYKQLVREYGAPAIEKGQVDILKACKWLLGHYRTLLQADKNVNKCKEK